ncbi:MAG: hydroxyacid dehydrogenase [Candidatus Omnitrophica bacterium]|nr:hydroxyacid dehydrogenase [Candidatus Omnitrophota bacterium]
MKKVVFFEIKGWEKKYIRRRLKGFKVDFFAAPLGEDNVEFCQTADIVSVFIYSRLSAKVLSKLKKLKFIATRSTGFDHIDIKEAKKRKILVANVPFYGENTVAEHTFALILSLSRNVHKSYLRTLRSDFSIEGLRGFDLKGRTIGVVGAGHIGMHVIRIAKGFGMEVLAYDLYKNTFLEEVLGFQYTSLEEILKKSDIISLHLPYNQHTHYIINKKNINLIKRGAIIINTSRGCLIETEALIEALDRGILSGAGLDVLEGEELIKEEKQLLYDRKKLEVWGDLVKSHILLSKDNVVFTPHIAFYSQEALERILDTTVDNIVAFSRTQPQNLVF